MKKLILVVEDEQEIRQDLIMTLKLSNYETLEAQNGRVALEILQNHKPDLIVSDIMMPELDGYGLISELQKNPDTSTIPFLFLSAKSDIREGMSFGADDFLTKPYDIDELLNAVEIRLRKKEASDTKYQKKFEEMSARINMAIPHEIRTPLGIILGYSDFLLNKFNTINDTDAKDMLQNILEAGKRMNRLFENHIFYAKLETISSNQAEVEKYKKGSFFLADSVIQDTTYTIIDNAGRKDDLVLNLGDGDPKINQEFLCKIIEELLDNAIKFSDAGTKISIVAQTKGNYYEISVHDNGRGMSKEQINSVGAYIQFERQIYEQQGSGLGIAIIKKIIGLIEGEFYIESELNNFTKVTVKIPLKN